MNVTDKHEDLEWLAMVVLDFYKIIRENGLELTFCGGDFNAFYYIESECEKILDQQSPIRSAGKP